MQKKLPKDQTDDELVETAFNNLARNEIGAAQAELMRRNTEALRQAKKSSDKSSAVVIMLTIVLLAVAILQLVSTVWTQNIPSNWKWFLSIAGVFFFFGITQGMKKMA